MSKMAKNGPPVYDPRGVVDVEPVRPAPRLKSLKGLRLGVLDNTKWNAHRLLDEITALLDAEFGLASVNYYKKENMSVTATPELIARIAAENDAVVTAVGD